MRALGSTKGEKKRLLVIAAQQGSGATKQIIVVVGYLRAKHCQSDQSQSTVLIG
jgi:hypothetical protein